MVVHYAAGSIQPLRMDNRENEFDSGIRVTCAYHLVPTSPSKGSKSSGAAVEHGQKTPVAQLLYSVAGVQVKDKESEKDAGTGPSRGPDKSDSRHLASMKRIDVEHDQ